MVYQFNQFTLDTNQYQLSLSDKSISIEPLVFDLLVYLIQHRNRVVTREELLENLWKGKVVTDAALGARLKDARKAIQDSGSKQAVIKTVHGRGYQFIANVIEAQNENSPATSEPWLSGEALPLPDEPSIAVLPFATDPTSVPFVLRYSKCAFCISLPTLLLFIKNKVLRRSVELTAESRSPRCAVQCLL
jgi:DNA-binding winged helix-turn-helix (wHTH) protein